MTVLDRAHFEMMTAGDRALQAEVLELFRGQVAGWTGAIGGDADWSAAIHTLKGSARGIGLHDLARLCEAAEAAPPEARPVVSEAVLKGLTNALAALEHFVAETPRVAAG